MLVGVRAHAICEGPSQMSHDPHHREGGVKAGARAHDLASDLLIWEREVSVHIEFWAFKVKCTQYEICEQSTFKNSRAIFLGIGQDMQQLSVRVIFIC